MATKTTTQKVQAPGVKRSGKASESKTKQTAKPPHSRKSSDRWAAQRSKQKSPLAARRANPYVATAIGDAPLPAEATAPVTRGSQTSATASAPQASTPGARQTKKAILISTLQRPEGATVQELIESWSGFYIPYVAP
jgi:hypothetical protein